MAVSHSLLHFFSDTEWYRWYRIRSKKTRLSSSLQLFITRTGRSVSSSSREVEAEELFLRSSYLSRVVTSPCSEAARHFMNDKFLLPLTEYNFLLLAQQIFIPPKVVIPLLLLHCTEIIRFGMILLQKEREQFKIHALN